MESGAFTLAALSPDRTPHACGQVSETNAEGLTELDALLAEAGKRGFRWRSFRGDHHGPDVLAGVFEYHGCADVFVFSSSEHAHAYRLPTSVDTDVFAPTWVCWWYGSCPVWTLRALLTLAAPGHRDAPGTLVPAPPGLRVSGDRVPVRMRSWPGRS